jgi:hypothetical protein
MSTWEATTAACPACGASVSMRVATSVHIARVPEVRTSVLERTLHRVTCVCGQKIAVDTAFTYVDVERGQWIQIEPVSRRDDWASVETQTMRALTRGLDHTSPIISGLAESARRRLVFGTEELREKLIVWDAGIDDGLLECLKLRAWIDEPTLIRAPLVAERMTDDGGVELVRVDEQPPRHFAVPASWVDRALDERGSLEARYPELFRGGFVNVLRLMTAVLLMLVGCSQPARRDTPPPATKDAGARVVDAAIEDAVPDVDARAPADGREHQVFWQHLRDRPSNFEANAAALIVSVRPEGNEETFIVLDRGKYENVQVGWKGRLLDSHDHRVSDVFEITKTDSHRSEARVRANVDQVNRTSRHVVLWHPAASEP